MICELWNNPLGWELRAVSGGELLRSEVCKFERDVWRVSDEWRAAAEAKGWTT